MTVSVELSYDQVRDAVRQLPREHKTDLWKMLGTDIDLDELRRQARTAVEEIREAYKHVPEEEVMADVDAAVKEVRAERRARRH